VPDIQDPSAWRNIRKCRQLKRPVGRPRKGPGLNLFYGSPAELIAEWCCVALSTAHAYKSGRLKPGKAAEKLFRLHRDRMILTTEWRGWIVKPDAIVDPEGNEMPPNLLRDYQLMLQYFRDLAKRSGDAKEMERWWGSIKVA
jgi:uncharacterized protein DUF3653